jgi:hypothetical protein
MARFRAVSSRTSRNGIVLDDRLVLEHEHHRLGDILVDALRDHRSRHLRLLCRHVLRMFLYNDFVTTTAYVSICRVIRLLGCFSHHHLLLSRAFRPFPRRSTDGLH